MACQSTHMANKRRLLTKGRRASRCTHDTANWIGRHRSNLYAETRNLSEAPPAAANRPLHLTRPSRCRCLARICDWPARVYFLIVAYLRQAALLPEVGLCVCVCVCVCVLFLGWNISCASQMQPKVRHCSSAFMSICLTGPRIFRRCEPRRRILRQM